MVANYEDFSSFKYTLTLFTYSDITTSDRFNRVEAIIFISLLHDLIHDYSEKPTELNLRT